MYAHIMHEIGKLNMHSRGSFLLNSKGEYNRCKLPRLTIDGGGGGEEGKNSFNSPALDAGYDKDIRESKVCHRTMKQEISSLEDKCALTQTGSQSETSANILSSCSIEQMSVKKRKRGSTWEMVNFIRLTIILCDCFRCHLLLYFDKKLKHVSINESLISWLFWFGSLATSPQPRYSCNGWWHLPLLHISKLFTIQSLVKSKSTITEVVSESVYKSVSSVRAFNQSLMSVCSERIELCLESRLQFHFGTLRVFEQPSVVACPAMDEDGQKILILTSVIVQKWKCFLTSCIWLTKDF